MRNHALAAGIGLLTAAFLAPISQPQAATVDPSGYWYKPDAERESKIQVFKCGKAKAQLCAKIVWLKEPNDSKGKALHDIRNEDPSMRDRPIVGLTIFAGMSPTAPGTWSGQIYNPEDGHTYSATLTMVSRTQIKLRGCKAWLLCGEKQWLRTSAPAPEVVTPPAPAEGTQQIEASADPSSVPSAPSQAETAAAPADPASAEAAAAEPASAEASPAAAPSGPSDNTREASATPQAAAVAPTLVALPKAELATPASPPPAQPVQPGYGFLNASTPAESAAPVSADDVSSMMVMTKPIAAPSVVPAAAPAEAATANPAAAAQATQAAQTEDPVPLPAQKPKAKAKPIATAAAAKPAAKPVTQAATTPPDQGAPAPQDTAAAQADPEAQGEVDGAQAATADAAMVEAPPLTRRQKRILRRQQHQEEPFLPWLR
jgi:uncharacterized protein (DUF2147 family)